MSLLSDTISEEATQSRLACKRLIQYVHQRGLEAGEQLPPQEELRRRLKFSHASLSRAMRAMVDHGMVVRRRRMGTVVADRDAIVPDLWTVALPIFSHGESNDLFITTLLRGIQGELAEAGCRWRVYMRQVEPDEDESNRLVDFPGLEEDLRNHRVDGVLSPALLNATDAQSLTRQRIPVCQVVSLENFACGIGIDPRAMIKEVVGRFVSEGRRRVALVSTSTLFGESKLMASEVFGKAVKEAGGRIESAELLGVSGAATRRGGKEIARSILSRDPSHRPDGLIVLADLIAVGLCEALSEAGCRPGMAVQTNGLVPLTFALPVAKYEVNVMEMARRGVGMILSRMRQPCLENERRWIVPVRSMEMDAHPEETVEVIRRQLVGAV